jgi:hypothetical protein
VQRLGKHACLLLGPRRTTGEGFVPCLLRLRCMTAEPCYASEDVLRRRPHEVIPGLSPRPHSYANSKRETEHCPVYCIILLAMNIIVFYYISLEGKIFMRVSTHLGYLAGTLARPKNRLEITSKPPCEIIIITLYVSRMVMLKALLYSDGSLAEPLIILSRQTCPHS